MPLWQGLRLWATLPFLAPECLCHMETAPKRGLSRSSHKSIMSHLQCAHLLRSLTGNRCPPVANRPARLEPAGLAAPPHSLVRVMIYLLLADRSVEIVADRGIATGSGRSSVEKWKQPYGEKF